MGQKQVNKQKDPFDHPGVRDALVKGMDVIPKDAGQMTSQQRKDMEDWLTTVVGGTLPKTKPAGKGKRQK